MELTIDALPHDVLDIIAGHSVESCRALLQISPRFCRDWQPDLLDGILDTLPYDVLGIIADHSAISCMEVWKNSAKFRREWKPARYHAMFIETVDSGTLVFGQWHSIAGAPAYDNGVTQKWMYAGKYYQRPCGSANHITTRGVTALDPPSDSPTLMWKNASEQLHRGGDLPAKITEVESSWWRYGAPYRANGLPDIVDRDGTRRWTSRDDTALPAIITPDGTMKWTRNGSIHRDDGYPAIIGPGIMEWHQYGMCHREDAPAVIGVGRVESWSHGTRYQKWPRGSPTWAKFEPKRVVPSMYARACAELRT